MVKAKVKEPFMHNGELLKKGKVVELDLDTAARLMKTKTLERDADIVKQYKEKQIARAEAIIKDSKKDW